MRRCLYVLFWLLPITANCQVDTSIFKYAIRTIEANDYFFKVPEKWTVFPQETNGAQLHRMEFTNVSIPPFVNSAPLTALCIFSKLNCDSLKAAEKIVKDEFLSYTDRVAPPGYSYDSSEVTIASFEKATLFSTHYYRRNKASNFTRYDMLVYSDKRKAAYWFTIMYQYKDPSYKIDEKYKLKEYALRIFRTLNLR